MIDSLNIDVAIVGGGITGLWLLSHLRACGYSALLVEGRRLGQGQTIASQGLIYGSSSYTLAGMGGAIDRTADSPTETWRRCLAGTGEVDLSSVRQLSQCQYLWVPKVRSSWWGRLIHPFKRKPAQAMPEGIECPALLSQLGIEGPVYRLDEPVLEVASLLQVLAEQQREAIVLNQGTVVLSSDGAITLEAPERNPITIRPRCCVFTAGVDNAALVWAPVKIRTLHMIMVRGKHLPDNLYAHCLSDTATPRLTITSHHAADGAVVWYLGGRLVEEGNRRRFSQQLREARRELARLLPKVELKDTQFAALRIRRVGSLSTEGERPGKPGISQNGKVIAAWSGSLSMVPKLAEAVIKRLERNGLHPTAVTLEPLADWPRPEVARYPWDNENLIWQ
ncbi:MAG: FAD-dependent oxidoreductase [Candidatus Competibacteraceae bacterium]